MTHCHNQYLNKHRTAIYFSVISKIRYRGMCNFVSTCALWTTRGLLALDERLNIDSEMRGKPGTLNYEDREKAKADIETINQ